MTSHIVLEIEADVYMLIACMAQLTDCFDNKRFGQYSVLSLCPEFRCGANGQPAPDPKPDYFGERDTGTKGLESTTLEIWPARHQHPPRELYICESQDEAYYGEAESDAETPGQASWERVHQLEPFTPGSVVELQLSLSDHSLDEGGTLTPPSRQGSSQVEVVHTSTTGQAIRVPGTGPWSGSLGQVEVTLQWPHKGPQGERTISEGSEPESSGRAEEDRGAQEAPPTAERLRSSSEEFDSEAEKDGGKPNKHQARHASEYPIAPAPLSICSAAAL